MGRENLLPKQSVYLSVAFASCDRDVRGRKETNTQRPRKRKNYERCATRKASKDAPRPRLLVARQAGRQPASYKQGSFCCVGMACESELPGLALPRLWFTLDFCRHLGCCLPWQAGKLNGMGLRGFSLKTGICCNTRRPLDAAPATSLARTALGAFS